MDIVTSSYGNFASDGDVVGDEDDDDDNNDDER